MTVTAHIEATYLPSVSAATLREARAQLQVWVPVDIGPPETWARFCQGDGKKFCCSRNGCHPLCNCNL